MKSQTNPTMDKILSMPYKRLLKETKHIHTYEKDELKRQVCKQCKAVII